MKLSPKQEVRKWRKQDG